ncbi:FAD binding domain-containing protein [Corynascus similis CBS 632.67]
MAITTVDVLIIGAGPAGLALANWFRNSGIRVLLVDKKPGPTPRGHAEGLKSTTNEIFAAFGIEPQIEAESWRLEEIAIWGESEDGSGDIVRQHVIEDKVEELGVARETILQQSRVEHHLLQNILSHTNIAIRYHTAPISVDIDTSCPHLSDEYPVTVLLANVKEDKPEANGTFILNGSNGTDGHHHVEERVRAKYVVGCDGAHSWLRKQLGVAFEGTSTDCVFGVADLIPKTDFPDIRRVGYLRRAKGTVLIIPRSNKEVRIYIPIAEKIGDNYNAREELTLERILAAARAALSPYTLEAGTVSWWSAYCVTQRVGSHFSCHRERAFLVGDAVHTHSPKAGQGLNTSVQDAYNLGWKLRLVLQGRISDPEALLQTYESERRPVAQDLIDFDRGYLKLFTGPSSQFDTEFLWAMKFSTGLSIRYARSCAVQLSRGAEDVRPSLLKADLVPGKRLQNFQAVYQADRVVDRIQRRMRATGAFRVIVFAGDIAEPKLLAKAQRWGEFLADRESGLGLVTMPSGGDNASAWQDVPVEILMVHCANRHQVELLDLHEIYRPWSSDQGYDYWRVLADAESVIEGHGRVYERLDIDKKRGRCVVIRPDGYIGAITDLDDFQGLRGYFEGIGLIGAIPN